MLKNLFTYNLNDFIMYSEEVYWATVRQYNTDIWPLQVFCLIFSLLFLFLLVKKQARYCLLFISFSCFFIGFIFYGKYLAEINLAASYIKWLFWLQAILSLWAFFKYSQLKLAKLGLNYFIAPFLFILSVFLPLGWLSFGEWKELLLLGWGGQATLMASLALSFYWRWSAFKIIYLLIPLVYLFFSFFLWPF